MSLEILQKVKDFLIKLVKDQNFSRKINTAKTDEINQIMQANGYNFSQEEFETAAIQILELKELDAFDELTEGELVGVVGGFFKRYPYFPKPKPKFDDPIIQPMYGVVIDPIVQPMYGVVIEPIDDPIVQPLYGVIIEPETF